jgi:hypothetical protein
LQSKKHPIYHLLSKLFLIYSVIRHEKMTRTQSKIQILPLTLQMLLFPGVVAGSKADRFELRFRSSLPPATLPRVQEEQRKGNNVKVGKGTLGCGGERAA